MFNATYTLVANVVINGRVSADWTHLCDAHFGPVLLSSDTVEVYLFSCICLKTTTILSILNTCYPYTIKM